MDATYRIISIGGFDTHPLWDAPVAPNATHATTTLIESEGAKILVDPSLPAQVLAARLAERANLRPADISHVFLTSFEPMRRRSLPIFEKATWWISEREREAIGVSMVSGLREAMESRDDDVISMLKSEVAVLEHCKAAPDQLAEGVDLFPLYGVTPGTCGILMPGRHASVLACGDAIASVEHLNEGKVLPSCADISQAQESFREALEIADLLILGRDNVVLNPLRRPF